MSEKSRAKRSWATIWWIVFITCLVAALFLSNQTGTSSAKVSNKVAREFWDPLEQLFPNLTDDEYVEFSYFVRKAGHFLVHVALAGSLIQALYRSFRRKGLAVILTVIIACAIAIFDEVVQLRAPGRVWAVTDIGINVIGALIGTCLSGITF